MKRATITLSDELEAELDAYLAGQEVIPSLTSIVQAALRSFLAERRGHRPGLAALAGGPWPSEVAEEPAAYGARAPSGAPSTASAWGTPRPPRARDLPALLASLPRLSESEAREMACDLDRARKELSEGRLDEPWSQAPSSDGPGERGA
jgi:hypothetical protein